MMKTAFGRERDLR